jgi:hypothetical protein
MYYDAAKRMAHFPGFRNGVFVSYAHGDGDPPLANGRVGWDVSAIVCVVL